MTRRFGFAMTGSFLSRYSPGITCRLLTSQRSGCSAIHHQLHGFTYLPRQDGCNHGTVGQYEFYVSSNGVNWGTPVATGTFNYGNANLSCGGAAVLPEQQVNFQKVSASYVRFRALSEAAGGNRTSAAEINVLHTALLSELNDCHVERSGPEFCAVVWRTGPRSREISPNLSSRICYNWTASRRRGCHRTPIT